MTAFVTPATLKAWLHDRDEIALFDVREHGQYGEAHLFYATPVPYSRLEVDAPRLAPRAGVRLCVYDDGDGVALRAAARLDALGYTNLHVLEGGAPAWAAAGYALFGGVNVPSKTFGELVEHVCGTPHISARELASAIARGDDLIVLDGRPFAEHQKMTIPGAICCPNGELAYRIGELAPNPGTRVVVHCAGRTRSIIGAQTLINLGIPNPVVALENGTQGWFLEDLELEHGSQRHHGAANPHAADARMQAASVRVAERSGVQRVDAATVADWAARGEHCVFLCDVRAPEEFAAGSLPGAQHTPGGQLIQATDQYIGVRHARLVLFDDDGIRAPVVASWLRQLGHDAYVLRDGLRSGFALPAPRDLDAPLACPALPSIEAGALAERLAPGLARVVDLRASQAFRRGHVPGALWSIRPRLPSLHDLTRDGNAGLIALIADDSRIAELAVSEWPDDARQGADLALLKGGFAAWRAAGLPVEVTPASPPDGSCIDYLFFVHDRHDGNKEAARQYLAWETGLIAQIDSQERAGFCPIWPIRHEGA
jgi:rhodanese-related sulfurtransferase